MSLHRRRVHAEYVEGCFGCAVGTIHVSPAAMVTRIESDRDYQFQARFAAEFTNGDREAYARLRRNGEQPPTIAGSADLERRAETSFEISTGAVTDNRQGLNAALGMCQDAGFDPLTPATTPLPEAS